MSINTKSLAVICCFSVLMNFKASAQNDSAYGKVYFMRLPIREPESYLEMAANYCNVFIDSNFICRLDEKKYFITSVPVGMHQFDMRVTGKKIKAKSESIFAVKSESISFNVEAGKSYYIQFVFKRYDNRQRLDSYIKYLTEERANMMLPDLKQDKSCYKDVNQK
ncbi:MAG: DUF2846 domain-containing protein [Flavitalea sp.]